MTDGPFRNTKLSSQWKRFGEDLINDATSIDERAKQACHSMINDIDMASWIPLIEDLKRWAENPQMDLDPINSIEVTFDKNGTSILSELLRKHLLANQRENMLPNESLIKSMDSVAKDFISITRSRLNEHCIEARDSGDMSRAEYDKSIDRNGKSFDAIDNLAFRDALMTGNKHAFSPRLRRKSGIDEGPEE